MTFSAVELKINAVLVPELVAIVQLNRNYPKIEFHRGQQ